jgi:hypothetical protein
MTSIAITGMGLTGVIRMSWVHDNLAHVLDHSRTDETTGTWTGLACPEHGLAIGADVDETTLRRVAAQSQAADLTWEASPDLASGHAQVFQSAVQAYDEADTERSQQLWKRVEEIWS